MRRRCTAQRRVPEVRDGDHGPAEGLTPPGGNGASGSQIDIHHLAVLGLQDDGVGREPAIGADHAIYGLACVLLYLVPAIVFLWPKALVAAELASGWSGGVFRWVSEGPSSRWGLLGTASPRVGDHRHRTAVCPDPSVSSVYWILSVMTTQVYRIVYLLIFVAAVRLRDRHRNRWPQAEQHQPRVAHRVMRS